MPPPTICLSPSRARWVYWELRRLQDHLRTPALRSPSERRALVTRTLRLLDELIDAFHIDFVSDGIPGTAEYDTARDGQLLLNFSRTYALGQRDLRIDLVSRAALQVWPDPGEMRLWFDGAMVDETQQSPYWSALTSEEGFKAALRLLERVAGEQG